MTDDSERTLADGWARVATQAGATVLVVDAPAATATIALKGAQVLAHAPRGQPDLLYLSPLSPIAGPAPIRGGIPVCWPWFGPHAHDARRPTHGFARTAPWQLIACAARPAEGGVAVTLRLPADPQTPASLTLTVTVAATLSLALSTENLGAAPLVITQALHTYFAVGDIAAVTIDGFDGAGYLDKTDAGSRKRQAGPIRFEREVDRVFDHSPGAVVLTDRQLGRRVHIAKSGSGATVVWNPWTEKAARLGDLPPADYRRFVCIETANAGAAAVTLAPGAVHRLETVYRVEPL